MRQGQRFMSIIDLSIMLFVYRYLCGTQDFHKDMEKKLSHFHGRDDALLYASGYDANTV